MSPTRAEQVDEAPDTHRRAVLEAPRRTDARQLPHEQPEIGAADVHEQSLQDVGMAAQVGTRRMPPVS